MILARRSVASARHLLRNQQPRRFDSHAAHHAAPVNESFGRSFYVAVGTFASCFALYQFTKTKDADSQSALTRLIEKWTPSEKTWEERNALHTAAAEKAASDRHLFLSRPPSEYYELKSPETSFAPPTPINNIAGDKADLSHVIAFYQEKNQKIEEARTARMVDGKVVSLYD
ncbi:putative NADH-ubiquinone oxidoreductase 178 kDa subunit [Aspergillus stella-maris]|uniref:putative NADH-ubiquinone oxidoreductase 178 kDa subunit n=1 Tax=Aspergillus stella-maris TaxID=1810926 RepID=UPI003CCCB8B2